MPSSPSSRFILILGMASACLFLAGAVACSGSSAPNAADDACSALAACCSAMSGATSSTCQSVADSARRAGSVSACTQALQAYAQGGLCGGAGFDAGALPSLDAALPCQATGSCPTGADPDASSEDAAATGSTTRCQGVGVCATGEPYQACVTTDAAGACAAAIVFPDGTALACASCTDCAAASVGAQAHCPTPPPVDAGPDCGTAPLLHPETQAGVYCPFTAAGAVHCAAGQQCCETPSTVANGSTCEPLGAACPVATSLAWACDGPMDCTGSDAGAVCCATGAVTLDPVCGFHRGAGLQGSHCAASCGAGEIGICDSPAEPCAGGAQCTPFKAAGVVLGTCL